MLKNDEIRLFPDVGSLVMMNVKTFNDKPRSVLAIFLGAEMCGSSALLLFYADRVEKILVENPCFSYATKKRIFISGHTPSLADEEMYRSAFWNSISIQLDIVENRG